MKTYTINIARAYTFKDWRGLPAHSFMARVELDDTVRETDALAELERLQGVYPWPEYHLTLTARETRVVSTDMASTAPVSFLEAHQWNRNSIHKGEQS